MSPDRYAKRVVNCDATFDVETGVGFIAVTGALGAHCRRVECGSNMAAEAMAVLFILEIAESYRRPPVLIVRTDCQAVAIGIQPGQRSNRDKELRRLLAEIKRSLARRQQFSVQHVDRTKVSSSHALARMARRSYLAGEGEIETFRVERLAAAAAVAVWE